MTSPRPAILETDKSPIILASGSEARHRLLSAAGVPHVCRPVRIDEEAISSAMQAEGATARDVADALAELKARKSAFTHPGAIIIGSDQVADLGGTLLSKPESRDAAVDQLTALAGRTHRLHSAAVVFEDGRPVWRHVSQARLTMRKLSQGYIADYVARNWDTIRHCVGCYRIEEEGARLFVRVEGDHFTIQGLPLTELLSYLILRGILQA